MLLRRQVSVERCNSRLHPADITLFFNDGDFSGFGGQHAAASDLVGGLILFATGIVPFGESLLAAQKDTNPGTGQTTSANPQYDPTADAIVGGLKSVATGTQAALGSYSDIRRNELIQNALLAAISVALSHPDKAAAKIDLTNVAILCDVSEEYTQAKAHTDHINVVTAGLDAVATPATINSLGDAITTLFKKYSITVKDNGAPAAPGATRDACISDLESWADDYYNKKNVAVLTSSTPATTTPGGIDTLFGDLSAVSGLISAVIDLITPIATYAATEKDKAARQAIIDKYLADPNPKQHPNKNFQTLVAEAKALATASNGLAIRARHIALGQFVEKMTALREAPIDLTKIKTVDDQSCSDALKIYTDDSEKIGLSTSAATAAGSSTLHFTAVPAWIKPDMKIYLTKASTAPDASVKSRGGPVTITISVAAPKGGIPKGTAVTFTETTAANATIPRQTVTLNTSETTPEGNKTLHFDTWRDWIDQGVKVTVATKPSISASVDSIIYTSVEMDKAATGTGVGANAIVQFTFATASEGYISCFAQLSKQINQIAADVVKAADNYDTAAQAQGSSAALTAKLDDISKAAMKTPPWPASKDSPAAQDAAELAAFGTAMQKAFANVKELQTALDAAIKQFGIH